jgi:branched-chain amino acid aminotransferase
MSVGLPELIFINGQVHEVAEARIDPFDRGLLLGDGLFETMLSRAGVTFRLGAHLARLASGAKLLGIPLPIPMAEIANAVTATVNANKLEHADAIVRITLTRGPAARGLTLPPKPAPMVMVTAVPYTAQLPEIGTACVVGPRRNELSIGTNIKTINYLENVLAAQEASVQGCDEGLMLNGRNHIACGSRSNLFAMLDGVLYTPPLEDGVLPGIVRAVVLEMAKVLHLKHRQAPLWVYDLPRITEAFITNSLIGVMPLGRIGEQKIGDGGMGPTTGALAKGYAALLAANRA